MPRGHTLKSESKKRTSADKKGSDNSCLFVAPDRPQGPTGSLPARQSGTGRTPKSGAAEEASIATSHAAGNADGTQGTTASVRIGSCGTVGVLILLRPGFSPTPLSPFVHSLHPNHKLKYNIHYRHLVQRLLIHEAEHFPTGLLSTCLVVVHDAESCCEDDVTEPTGREDVLNPLLDVLWNTRKEGKRGITCEAHDVEASVQGSVSAVGRGGRSVVGMVGRSVGW